MDKNIAQSISKTLDGGKLNAAELRDLFAVHYLSEEAFMIQQASRKLSEITSKGKAEVHAQVGIDTGPCAKNCDFCSFAQKNKLFREPKVYPIEEIIEKCLQFETDGANAIYLMATAAVLLSNFIKIAQEVKKALKSEIPLVANIDDFDEDGAKALKNVGIAGIYHCVRIGEGKVTAIDQKIRINTIYTAQKAGLILGTSVGPVGPEHTLDDLVETTLLTRELRPVNNASCRRVNIPGLPLSIHGSMKYGQMAHILGVVRLASGYDIIGHGTHEPNGIGAMSGANLFWAEQGANPRDTSEHTVRGWTVKRTQEVLEEAGWDILQGPSVMFGSK